MLSTVFCVLQRDYRLMLDILADGRVIKRVYQSAKLVDIPSPVCPGLSTHDESKAGLEILLGLKSRNCTSGVLLNVSSGRAYSLAVCNVLAYKFRLFWARK